MRVTIQKGKAQGKVNAPYSKSYAHRLLICSALSENDLTVDGIEKSEDMLATLDCVKTFGRNFCFSDKKVAFSNFCENQNESKIFNCRESGSTLRFFIPIALALLEKCEFCGTSRLISRGLGVYEEICKSQNIDVSYTGKSVSFSGKLKPDNFKVRGDISSQFISGLFFALPLLDGDSTVEITTKLESRPYVDITIDVLSRFGIEIKEEKENFFRIKGNQRYKGEDSIAEGDFSNSAFLDAFNVLGGNVFVEGLNPDSLQGDKVYKEYFEIIKNGYVEADISSCPDLAPILFALCGAKYGGHFTGTKRLKIKESDRAEAMAEELLKFGIRTETGENEVTVYNSNVKKPTQILCGHNDHRIVMALSVLLSTTGGEIDGAEAVNKSFPDFFERLNNIGIEAIINDN